MDTVQSSPRQKGDSAEFKALLYLQSQGLSLIQRNYRVRGQRGNEIDLIMRQSDGTVVFVEVRSRRRRGFGGAAASVTAVKQRKIMKAAQHFLLQWRVLPACRFDVVSLDPDGIVWYKAAFDAVQT